MSVREKMFSFVKGKGNGLFFLIYIFGAAGFLQGSEYFTLQTARISSMAGAVTASAEDLSETRANSAALASMTRAQVLVDRVNFYQSGMVNSFFAGYFPVFGKGGMDLTWNRLSAGQALGFDDTEDVINLGLSRNLFGIKSGISFEYSMLNSLYGTERFNRRVFDVGAGFQKWFSVIRTGINFRNILSGIKDLSVLELQAGAAGKPWSFLLVEADYSYRQGRHGFNVGARWRPRDEFDFSGGWFFGSFFSAGISLYVRGFNIDYTLRIPQNADLLLTHDMALRFTFWE